MKRSFSKLTIAATLCCLSSSVLALGFGRLNSIAVLGQTLNLAIPIRLDPGEELSPDCVAADVYFGDAKQLPDLVRVQIDGHPGIAAERTLRVLSATPVNEPIVTIYLVAGCHAKITRKFVAFADPPRTADLPVVSPALEGPLGSAAKPAADQATPPIPARHQDTTASTRRRASGGHHASVRERKRAASATAPATSHRHQASSTLAGLDTRGAHLDRHARHRPPAATASSAATSTARLELDPVDADLPIAPELRLSPELSHVDDDSGPGGQAVRDRRAAAAALWRALNATPEQLAHDRQRLQELEARLSQIQTDRQAAQTQIQTLQNQVAQARRQRSAGPVAMGLAGLSMALAVALGWLLLRQRRARQGEWWTPDAEPSRPTEPARHTLAASGTGLSTQPVVAASLLKSATEIVPPQPAPVAPAVAPALAPVDRPAAKAAPREVSVEELIDLEQQAEFFMVLGQDDAAIELLKGHIEGSEGTSPLPYLKLLEVYQRVGDREAYEQLRERFNAQFNAYAPAWDADLQHGHELTDYVGVIERLQALWDVPERAMDVLQASLLRHDPAADTFDLPAYRELLFLYSVARDLSERDARPSGAAPLAPVVDVLLPIDEAAGHTEPVEPLIATRPVKTSRSTQSAPLAVDVTLDDLAGTPRED